MLTIARAVAMKDRRASMSASSALSTPTTPNIHSAPLPSLPDQLPASARPSGTELPSPAPLAGTLRPAYVNLPDKPQAQAPPQQAPPPVRRPSDDHELAPAMAALAVAPEGRRHASMPTDPRRLARGPSTSSGSTTMTAIAEKPRQPKCVHVSERARACVCVCGFESCF
jgi:hypothetical protein